MSIKKAATISIFSIGIIFLIFFIISRFVIGPMAVDKNSENMVKKGAELKATETATASQESLQENKSEAVRREIIQELQRLNDLNNKK